MADEKAMPPLVNFLLLFVFSPVTCLLYTCIFIISDVVLKLKYCCLDVVDVPSCVIYFLFVVCSCL